MSSFAIKMLGIILMLIDHIGYLLFPNLLILRYIGRLAYPLFAFQIVQGFKHTRSKEKYIVRMLIFTVISQIPYWLFIKSGNSSVTFSLNVGATFTIGLLALYVIEKIDNKILKFLITVLVVSSTLIVPVDYGWYGVLTIITFFLFEKKPVIMTSAFYFLIILYCILKMSYFEITAIFAIFPISLYNGKQGKKTKYLFYAFYPLHMLILLAINLLF